MTWAAMFPDIPEAAELDALNARSLAIHDALYDLERYHSLLSPAELRREAELTAEKHAVDAGIRRCYAVCAALHDAPITYAHTPPPADDSRYEERRDALPPDLPHHHDY